MELVILKMLDIQHELIKVVLRELRQVGSDEDIKRQEVNMTSVKLRKGMEIDLEELKEEFETL